VKLKKLIITEIALVAVILVVALIVIEGIPYLEGSQQTSSVSMYQEREYGKGNVTLARGENARTRFNYSTYDPSILVIELSFQNWQSPGNLTLLCNGKQFASFVATPEKPIMSLSVTSVSGQDWLRTYLSTAPSTASNSTLDNEITFSSEPLSGYAGTFDYRIAVRGSL
jgi:hypothetical protein